MSGDVVRRITSTDTQRGYCREISVKADLKIIGKSRYVIKDVSSERLVPLLTVSWGVAIYWKFEVVENQGLFRYSAI